MRSIETEKIHAETSERWFMVNWSGKFIIKAGNLDIKKGNDDIDIVFTCEHDVAVANVCIYSLNIYLLFAFHLFIVY